MRLPKLRELALAIRSLVTWPFTNGYPFKSVTIPDGFRGKPEYNEQECVGCLACYEVCPARAIDYVDDKDNKYRTLTHNQERCIFCQQCELACITKKGITLTKEFELGAADRKTGISQSRKELTICEKCGEVVGCTDHLYHAAKKLGVLLYGNPTLMLARNKELQLVEDRPQTSSHQRGDHLKLLCPNCRREVILREQW
ncbi:hypothetical protein A2311_06755 [candidate division WOR-1 bacterium RIFOXYB2_FULL_48_7]|uniref:4Fe-4S ferredoxin-type domain-containing protein n=1 Tax=candidate division WOR-1 bacterium RIFOXYB2_FULL_48_7 TaxID=1802583 RepID=A0A1F4T9N6_UNCSA|nr:MAG: hypothetical protein A2311_06755 [candidate division WOR-1 bacterium RIFOXYB2_FULL_48_7]